MGGSSHGGLGLPPRILRLSGAPIGCVPKIILRGNACMSPSNGVLQPVPDPRIVKREGRTPEVPAMPFRRWSSQEYPMRGLIAKEGSPEVALNQKVKNLIQKLGEEYRGRGQEHPGAGV